MNVNIPDDLMEQLAAAAKYCRVSPEEALLQAIAGYIESQRALKEELDGWRRARGKALRKVLGDAEEKWE